MPLAEPLAFPYRMRPLIPIIGSYDGQSPAPISFSRSTSTVCRLISQPR